MKKIVRLELENFQSHARTVLDLTSGLNVVVGPSDQGKSALIRGLRWLIYNEPRGTDFMRTGSATCRVKVVLDTGETIIRERTSSKNRYIQQRLGEEEQIFEGFGNTIPWEISSILQMPKIALDTDKNLTLNLASQLESPFLLEEGGTSRAKMIGRLTGVHIIDAAMRATTRDLMTAQQEEKKHKDTLTAMAEKLDTYQSLPALEKCIVQLELLLEKANFTYQRRKKLGKLAEQKQRIEEDLSRDRMILKQMANVEQLEQALSEMDQRLQRYHKLKVLQNRIVAWKKEYLLVKNAWSDLQETEQVEELLKRLAAKIERWKWLSEKNKEFQKTAMSLQKGEMEIQRLEKQIAEVLKKYQEILAILGKCPVCFAELNQLTLEKIIADLTVEGGRTC